MITDGGDYRFRRRDLKRPHDVRGDTARARGMRSRDTQRQRPKRSQASRHRKSNVGGLILKLRLVGRLLKTKVALGRLLHSERGGPNKCS